MKVGHLRQVVPVALEFAFELVTQGTALEGAELVLDEVPAGGLCRACGLDEPLDGFPLSCWRCGGSTSRSSPGEELLVDALELEDETTEVRAWPLTKHPRRGGGPHPLDLGGHELRRRLGLRHRRRPARHRGRAARRDPRHPEGPPAQQGAVADARRRGVPAAVPPGRARRARRAVRARHRGLDPQREHQRRRLLDLVRQRRGDRRAADAQLVDRPARAEGVGRRRHRHVRDLRRHPRDGRQPDRAAWAWPTTSAGTSARPAGCRSSTSPAARCSRRTSWRRSSGCSTRRPGSRP